MLTTDRDALYAAILANPDDDAPRLIFADYLEENGEAERAKFIRLQIELAKYDDFEPEREQLRRDIAAVYTKFSKKQRWQPALPRGVRYPLEMRGFVAKVTCPIATFLSQAERLFATIPLTELSVSEARLSEASFAALGASPHLRRLRTFTVFYETLTDAMFGHLANSPHAVGLRKLEFYGCQGLTDVGLRQLMDSPHLANVRALDLANTLCGDDVAQAVVEAPRFANFKHFSFNSCSLRDAGLEAMIGSKYNQQVQYVNASYNPALSSDGAKAFAKHRNAQRLVALDLHHTSIDGPGIRTLLTSKNLGALRYLDVSDMTISTDIPAIFAGRWTLPNLERIELRQLSLDDATMQVLFQRNRLPKLRVLMLEDNKIGNEGVEALAARHDFTQLESISLKTNRITSRGIIALAASPLCKTVRALDLSDNRIDDKGAQALLDSPYLKNLVHLDVSGNKITPAMRRKLQRAFGNRGQA